MSTLHPNVSVTGARDAIDFYVRAFGAELVYAIEAQGAVVHSELTLGGSTFTVAEAWPSFGSVAPGPDEPTHASFTVEVEDTDAAFARAVAAGARAVDAPEDAFHGGRTAQVRCPFGHRWFLNHQTEQVSPEELQRRADAWSSSQSSGAAG
jgi:PhnB protein